MSRVADTSFLYALYNADDAHHEDAGKDLRTGQPVYVPMPVLTETVALIHYRQGYATAKRVLTHLLELPIVRVREGAPLPAVVAAYGMGQGKLSFVDSVVVETCHAFAAKPLTYDKAIHAAVR